MTVTDPGGLQRGYLGQPEEGARYYRLLGVVAGALLLALALSIAFFGATSGLSEYAWIGASFAVVVVLVLKAGFRGRTAWNAMTNLLPIFSLLAVYSTVNLAGGLLFLWVAVLGENRSVRARASRWPRGPRLLQFLGKYGTSREGAFQLLDDAIRNGDVTNAWLGKPGFANVIEVGMSLSPTVVRLGLLAGSKPFYLILTAIP